jgi:hypothetical protein
MKRVSSDKSVGVPPESSGWKYSQRTVILIFADVIIRVSLLPIRRDHHTNREKAMHGNKRF